jgi:tRNA(Ile)-lysidine synthase
MKKKNSNVLSLKNQVLNNKKIAIIYYKFELILKNCINKNSFVIAVSGGPDSLALSALGKVYAQENKMKIFFVLIDHGIRKNSNNEAKLVKKLLKKKGISLNIVKNKKKISNNIQKKAREIRYNYLLEFCKKKNINFILTGHHRDDQIETFLIRLSRGSGVQGLSSMKKITKLSARIKLIRPLLEIKKKDLTYTAKSIFKKFIKDPSNKDKKYLRTKIRLLINNFEKNGINLDQITRSINNLASTRDTLNNYISKIIKSCVKIKGSKTYIKTKSLFIESDEIQIKILGNVIKRISKNYYPPRTMKILNLLKRVKSKKNIKFTLGGCILERSKDNLVILRENNRKINQKNQQFKKLI